MHAGGSVIFSDGWGAINIWGKKLVVALVVLGAVCVCVFLLGDFLASISSILWLEWICVTRGKLLQCSDMSAYVDTCTSRHKPHTEAPFHMIPQVEFPVHHSLTDIVPCACPYLKICVKIYRHLDLSNNSLSTDGYINFWYYSNYYIREYFILH